MELVPLLVMAGIAWFIYWCIQENKAERRQEQERAAEAIKPCHHGTRGAYLTPSKCPSCKAEAVEAQRLANEAYEREQQHAAIARATAYAQWIAKVRLPEYLVTMDPQEFEGLVCLLFQTMGYRVEPTRYFGDSGVDAFLYKGEKKAVVQCKRVKASIGEPVLRDLFGTMHATDATSAIVVTTGRVSRQAREWVSDKPIRLIELDELTRLVRRHFKENDVVPTDFRVPSDSADSGLDPCVHSVISCHIPPSDPREKTLDPEICPQCGNLLRRVEGPYEAFIECSAYPVCRYTRHAP